MTFLIDSLVTGCSGQLLAVTPNRKAQMGRQFPPSDSGFDLEQLITMASVVAIGLAIVVLVWLINSRYRAYCQQDYHSPRRLFRELARAHQLTSSDCQLLREIAAWHELPMVALLFVEPTCFYAPQMIESLGKPEQITRLAEKLFATQS